MEKHHHNRRRFLSTRVHGLLDYAGALLLLASPLFPMLAGVPEASSIAIWTVPAGMGAVLLVSTFFTNFEYGVVKLIPLKTHLTMDYMAGLFLAASPWLFRFQDQAYWPHLLLGLAIFIMALITRMYPGNVHRQENPEDARILY